MAMIENIKLDVTFSRERLRPENRNELEDMQRKFPPHLPNTHVWEYFWVDPTEAELAANPRVMPVLERGPRELMLQEIAEKSRNFEKLNHGELRFLFDKYNVPALPLDKKNPKPDELESLRDALRAYLKKAPAVKPVSSVIATPTTAQTGAAVTLPEDVAKMGIADIETQAAQSGLHDEWKSLPKSVPIQRAWLATKRAEKKELEQVAA